MVPGDGKVSAEWIRRAGLRVFVSVCVLLCH